MNKWLSAERARALLSYDEATGRLYWRADRRGKAKAGSEAGYVKRASNSKYLCYKLIRVDGHQYRAHRLAWLIVNGEWPADDIDHIDGDGLNNTMDNLRAVTRSENMKNAARYGHNTSGINGVSWDNRENKWRAYIKVSGKQIHLGYLDTIEEAISLREKVEIEFSFHKNHGRNARYG